MSIDLAPTLELEAVNDMLSVIGEAQVASIDETIPDVQQAVNLLRMESRALQAKGWHFNTDDNLALTPDAEDGTISLPQGTLKVDTVGDSASLDLAYRAGKLYDRRRQSFDFATYPTVYVDLVVLLDFESLPETVRTAIRIKAGRKLLSRTGLGTETSLGYEAEDEKDADAALQVEEEANADRSIFDNAEYAGLMYARRPGR